MFPFTKTYQVNKSKNWFLRLILYENTNIYHLDIGICYNSLNIKPNYANYREKYVGIFGHIFWCLPIHHSRKLISKTRILFTWNNTLRPYIIQTEKNWLTRSGESSSTRGFAPLLSTNNNVVYTRKIWTVYRREDIPKWFATSNFFFDHIRDIDTHQTSTGTY